MYLQLEIYKARKNQQSIQIACAGLEGAALREFNQKQPRGLDGRFGSGGFRSQEIRDVGNFYKELVGDEFGNNFQQFKDYFAKGEYKAFQKAVEARSVEKLETALAKVADVSIGALGRDLVAAIAGIEFAPIAVAHILVGEDLEKAAFKAATETIDAVKKAAAPLTKKGTDLFIAAEEIFDRAITKQIAADPDLSGKSKKVKLKAFNTAVAQFKIACENKTLFAPLIRASAARLLISRLTKLGDEKTARSRVAKINMENLPEARRVEATQVAIDFYQLVGQPLDIKDFKQGKGADGKDSRGYCNPFMGFIQFTAKGWDIRNFLFHEMAHFTDGKDNATAALANAFVEKRATGQPRSLQADMGSGYSASEVYLPDAFIDKYVGKFHDRIIFSDRRIFPEVMSMGFQSFADSKALANLGYKDPEHLDLVLNYQKMAGCLKALSL